MDELGNLLREAREARGLSLSEAQESTRINSEFLQALEEGRYHRLPSQVHVRGYLKNYAKYLHLDPQPLLDRYELDRSDFTAEPVDRDEEVGLDEPLRSREDRVFFDPVNMEVSGSIRQESSPYLRIIIIFALIVTLGLIGYRGYLILAGDDNGAANISAAIEDIVSDVAANGEDGDAIATPTTDITQIPGAGDTITSTNRNAAIQLPTPTATRPTLPATMETIQLRLEITERTWMQVTIDGEIVFQGIARKGDEPYEWEAQDSATLLTGNAIGIFVTINDVPLGRLGARGEVADETWTTTSTG